MSIPETIVAGTVFDTKAGTAVPARTLIENERLDPSEIATNEGLLRGILRYLRLNYLAKSREATYLVTTDEMAGSITKAGFPSVAGTLVRITAAPDNAGYVHISSSNRVVAHTGTTGSHAGKPLAPGEWANFFVKANLNELYYISDNAGDDLIYEVYA